MENIAKSTSYGCYLDCDFETAKYPDDKTHIVGLLAEYVYDLEQRILHYDERYIKLWNEIETLRECVSKEFDQEQKISDLEAKLKALQNGIIDDETLNMLVKEHKLYKDLETKLVESNESHHKNIVELTKMVTEKDRKIEELKQQLHDLPKKIVEDIRIAIFEGCREYFNAEDDGVIQYTEITPKKCNKILDAILKKYGVENE